MLFRPTKCSECPLQRPLAGPNIGLGVCNALTRGLDDTDLHVRAPHWCPAQDGVVVVVGPAPAVPVPFKPKEPK